MWGRTLAAEAWNAVSFFSKAENTQGEGKNKWKNFGRLTKMTKLAGFFFKSRMLMIIRHSEIKVMVQKSDFNWGTMSGCFRGS